MSVDTGATFGARSLRGLFRRGVEDDRDERERRRVELLVQWLRWLAVVSWGWLVQGMPGGEPAALVYAVYGATLVYAAACHVTVRRASAIDRVSVLTTVGDTIAIAAMCLVSGGLESPIFPVFFLSVLATTIRFGMAEAFLIATLDAAQAAVIHVVVGGTPAFELAENVFYLYFVALLGGLLSDEARRQHGRAVKERERASLLLSVNRQIVAAADLRELLGRILRMTLDVVPARGACFLLRGGANEEIDPPITAGRLPPLSPERCDRLLRCERIESGGESVIAPIHGAVPHGVLVVVANEGSRLSDEETQLVGAVAEETAVAIDKARLGADLALAQARSRELLHRMIDAEEAERRRIAGELHDRMGKRFFEFYYDVRLLQGMSVDRDPGSSEILERIIESARDCAGEIRTLMNDLRPSVLDDFGFLEAMKEFVTAIAARGELDVTLSIDENATSAGPQADLMLFRVLQEAVFNARKHAAAKQVEVVFGPSDDHRLRLVVRDDGCGFDLEAKNPGHYGLLYMKERAEACGGEFAVRGGPRQGTEIEVTVPIPS